MRFYKRGQERLAGDLGGTRTGIVVTVEVTLLVHDYSLVPS